MGMRYFLIFALAGSFVVNAQDYRKWNGYVGAGPSFGIGDTGDRVNTGWAFNGGGGYNFSKNVSLNVDYIYNRFGLSDKTLEAAGAPDGFATLWGFSLNPMVRTDPEKRFGGYVTGGYGVMTRTGNLTRPGVIPAIICDPWTGICWEGSVIADVIYRSNSTTKGGWNIGGGFTVNLGESGAQFYTEIRFYQAFTSDVKTTVMPLTFGVRW